MSSFYSGVVEVRGKFPGYSLQVLPGCVLSECLAIRLVGENSHLLVVVVIGKTGRELTSFERALVSVVRERYPVTSVHWLYVTEQRDSVEFTWRTSS